MDEEKTEIREEDLHFYYDRSKRLENAPDIVRSYYDGTAPTAPKGFFQALVHTRMSRFLLGGLVLSSIMILFAILVSEKNNANSINEINFELSAYLFEDTIYTKVTAAPSTTKEDTLVTILFRALGTDKIPIAETEIYSNYDGNEKYYGTTFINYDILFVESDVSVAGETITLNTAVSK